MAVDRANLDEVTHCPCADRSVRATLGLSPAQNGFEQAANNHRSEKAEAYNTTNQVEKYEESKLMKKTDDAIPIWDSIQRQPQTI